MIAVIGIMACVSVAVGVIIGGGIAAVGTGYAIYNGERSSAQAEDIANKQRAMQEQAQTKAENRAKAMKLVQERQAASSLLKTQQAVGGSIMLNEILAERAELKANRTRMENSINKPSQKLSHDMGTPQQKI